MLKLALRARLFIRKLWWEVRRWATIQELGYDPSNRWEAKQKLAAPSRYYGDGGTVHRTTYLHVETDRGGVVVAVWFRCIRLPFVQVTVTGDRAAEMLRDHRQVSSTLLTGVEVRDPDGQ
jgi:hypothetical protein